MAPGVVGGPQVERRNPCKLLCPDSWWFGTALSQKKGSKAREKIKDLRGEWAAHAMTGRREPGR